MKKLFIMFLLIVGLLIPAVSAEILYDENFDEYEFTGGRTVWEVSSRTTAAYIERFIVDDIAKLQDLQYIAIEFDRYQRIGNLVEGRNEITYTTSYDSNPKTAIVETTYYRDLLGNIIHSKHIFYFPDWDIGDATGQATISIPAIDAQVGSVTSVEGDSPVRLPQYIVGKTTITVASGKTFKNHLLISDNKHLNNLNVKLTRTIDGKTSASTLTVYGGSEIFYNDYSSRDVDENFLLDRTTLVTLAHGDKIYEYPISSAVSPTPTPSLPTTRTGTVTMTDHNGTTIRGFSVKAVNYYTGEEYTASTETDVAVITLPMDRTISLRNPQTGQYEDVPVGYYLFFGEKPGYKMTNEDGIRITVMPVEYSSYHFGDIIVTQESGYLTGKHLFQIRSRADNSILQTVTISAQSATTGEWYNATVIDGLATLILPYDTSNPISQYAGNYYVYATSPGYEDSEYATQITVMPHTQSEINTIYLTPIGGIPEPGNVTLRIQAFSESGPGIPNAEIFISGVFGAGEDVWDTYIASSTGYLEVSVPGNSTYVIQVSAQGYFDTSRRIEVFMEDPPLLEFKLYPTGEPTLTPTTQPTGWVTPPPTTQPPGGIPDEDDDSEGFLMEAIRGISKAFGVGFGTAKTIFGMLIALAIGFATAKQLRGGAAEFGLGLLGGTMLGVLIGLIPIWVIVVLLLIVGMYIGYRYVGGGNNG